MKQAVPADLRPPVLSAKAAETMDVFAVVAPFLREPDPAAPEWANLQEILAAARGDPAAGRRGGARVDPAGG
ncbi:MAG: hypothetical protein ABW032_09830 [Burkholderiaceae bacterium]